MLWVNLDREDRIYAPGERLTVKVTREGNENADKITVNLFWYTVGAGIQDVELVQTQCLDTLPGRQEQEFNFKLPDSPYSFSGPLGELRWCVEAVTCPENKKVPVDFELLPAGKKIVLPSVEKPQKGGWRRLRSVQW